MSLLTDKHTGDAIDTMGTGPMMNNVRVPDGYVEAALRYLARHDALDLAPVLGLTE